MPIFQRTILEQSTVTLVLVVPTDITARKLTFRAKRNNNDDSKVLVQKQNQLAGASDDTELYAEALDVTSAKTKISVYLDGGDTLQSYSQLYCYVESEDPDDSADVDIPIKGEILIEKRSGSIPVGFEYAKSTLTLTKYAHWKMVAGVITVKAMSGWAANPTATQSGGSVTITSSGAEIPLGAKFNTTNQDFDTGTWTTASRVINYNDVTGTIEFWIAYYE